MTNTPWGLLKSQDPILWRALAKEADRQEQHLELIASENYTYPEVLAAQGSILTNKYAEGYPGKRYYAGCEFIDEIENLAIERAQQLFKAEYVNVQPHSGSQANAAVYLALLKPGETLLGMALNAGGHLTHGAPVSFSGTYYRAIQYGLSLEGYIDYEAIRGLARAHQPKIVVAGFSAYSRPIDWKIMREIADEVGAYLCVDMAHIAGPIAAGLLASPLPYAHVVTCTTHKTLCGPRGGMILSSSGDPSLYKKLNSAVFPGLQGGPLPQVIAGKAICFLKALQPEFREYQRKVLANARAMCKRLQKHQFSIVSGGTDNHLFLVDLSSLGISGKAAELRLYQASITLNKNTIPREQRSAFVTSGIRIGTPAITRRGMGEREAEQIADWIVQLLSSIPTPDCNIANVKEQVTELCAQFPVYPSIELCN